MRKKLSATEAAKYKGDQMGCTFIRTTVQNWCRKGLLGHEMVGGRYIIYSDVLDKFKPPRLGRPKT